MPTVEFETSVAAPLETVWTFFEDVKTSLPALTSPQEGVVVESADVLIQVGSRIVLSLNAPVGRRIRWVAKIVEHVPPHAVVFGREARFVDEQESGPFRAWRHAHEFEAIDDRSTRVVDRVTYRVPFGPIGWIADAVFVRPKIRRAFRYRHDQLRRCLEGPG